MTGSSIPKELIDPFVNRAVGYCQEQIREPRNTILVLISDLYEVSNRNFSRAHGNW
jgi:hypothetical protein